MAKNEAEMFIFMFPYFSAFFSDGGGSVQIYRSQSSALLVSVCLSETVLGNSTDPNSTAKCF